MGARSGTPASTRGRFKFVWLCLMLASCASPDQNPALPAAGKGYVDFFASSALPVYWEIRRLDEGRVKVAYSELEEPAEGVVRLAVAPGEHRFQILVLNHVTYGPAECTVTVAEGKIVPVRLDLLGEGESLVEEKETRLRPTLRGGVGRGTVITDEATRIYRVVLTPQNSEPYRVKNQMGYWPARE